MYNLLICVLYFSLLSFVVSFDHYHGTDGAHGQNVVCDPVPGTPVNDPLGEENGYFPKPGRVVWIFNPDATNWDGKNDTYLWEPQNLNQTLVDSMFDDMILKLTDEKDIKSSWDEIFKSFNSRRYGNMRKYTKGEKIVVKINLNGDTQGYHADNFNQVTPQFLKSMLRHLVDIVGVEQEDISIYDASRLIQPFYYDSPQGIGDDYPNVGLVDNNGGEDYVTRVEPDMSSYLVFSNEKVANYNGTKLPTIVQDATYMIVLDDFRGHTMAGVTLSGKNFFGSIYRDDCSCDWYEYISENPHWCPKSLHDWIIVTKVPMGTYSPFVDFLGHNKLGGNGLLFLSDGLYGGPFEDTDLVGILPVPFLSTPFNNHWSSSIFASLDGIALDSLLYDILRNEPNVPLAHKGCVDNYLHEGAQADNPPSGTTYNPTGETPLSSLGIHEHWNNADDKQYSRNLGQGKGIELVKNF